MNRFMLFQMLVIGPFVLGFFAKRHFSDPKKFSRKIILANLALLEPVIALWSIWGLGLTKDFIVLPCAGLALVTAGFILGRAFMPLLGLKGKSAATYIISSSLANHGYTMGSFVCFLFLGEKGIGLASIFLLYFVPYTYGFIFFYARTVSGGGNSPGGILPYIINTQNLPLCASLAALALHLCGVKRPGAALPLDWIIALSAALYYFTLGMNFDFRGIRIAKPEQLALAATKFLLIPGAALLALRLAPPGRDAQSVIILQAFMPAAIYSVVTSVLFGLDEKLASNLFAVNTLIFTCLILPALLLLNNFGFF